MPSDRRPGSEDHRGRVVHNLRNQNRWTAVGSLDSQLKSAVGLQKGTMPAVTSKHEHRATDKSSCMTTPRSRKT